MQVFRCANQILIALAITLIPVVSGAERVDGERIVACSTERDDARRLACYDSAVRSAGTPIAEPPVAASAVSQSIQPHAPTAAASNEDEFGIDGSEVAKKRRVRQSEFQETEIRSLSAVVTEVASEARGILVITLDNDQRWRQKTPQAYFPIEVGDRVTINAGMLGSYRMVNGKRSTQVTRVK